MIRMLRAINFLLETQDEIQGMPSMPEQEGDKNKMKVGGKGP